MAATGGQHICSIDGCDRPAHARTWCIGHYQRWRTNGAPGGPLREYLIDPATRFWAKVDQDGPIPEHRPDLGPCWIWTGNLTKPNGYGRFYPQQTGVLAHRWAWEQEHGPIPDGLQLDHLCRVKQCIRHEHLDPVTNAENVRRAVAVRTHCPNGHAYPDGVTRCAVCAREAKRRHQAAKSTDPAWRERRREQERARYQRGKEQGMTPVIPPPCH